MIARPCSKLHRAFETRDTCFVIAEIAQAHEGSLGLAHSFIEAAARSNADAVKFQTHIADAESTPDEPWRVKFSPQDATRYEYWKRMEFTPEQWAGLKRHADDCGILFLSSPFSLEAFQLLNRLNVPAWKVASGEVTNEPLVRAMVDSGKPLLVSSGMSPIEEIDEYMRIISHGCAPVALFQCTSQYPCPEEEVGLNILHEFRERYGCAVGLSDHSGEVFASLAAAALGATFLEVHATFSKDMFGPDARSSLTFEQLSMLTQGVKSVTRMVNSPVDKDTVAARLAPLRKTFMKSVVVLRDLPAGTILTEEMLGVRKPGGSGIPATELTRLVNKRLTRDVSAMTFLEDKDLASH